MIADEADLKAYRELLEGEPVEGLELEDINVGTLFQMSPCVSDAELQFIQERYHQPCPLVDISEDNIIPFRLVMFAVNERTRPFVEPILSSVPEAERAAVALRAASVLNDEDVVAELERIQREYAEERARERGATQR